MALTKELLDQSFSVSFDDALDREAAVAATNMGFEDAVEALPRSGKSALLSSKAAERYQQVISALSTAASSRSGIVLDKTIRGPSLQADVRIACPGNRPR